PLPHEGFSKTEEGSGARWPQEELVIAGCACGSPRSERDGGHKRSTTTIRPVPQRGHCIRSTSVPGHNTTSGSVGATGTVAVLRPSRVRQRGNNSSLTELPKKP